MKKEKIKSFNYLIGIPLISAVGGFGMFWIYNLFGINVFISIFVGCYTSSSIAIDFIKNDR